MYGWSHAFNHFYMELGVKLSGVAGSKFKSESNSTYDGVYL